MQMLISWLLDTRCSDIFYVVYNICIYIYIVLVLVRKIIRQIWERFVMNEVRW